MLSKNYQFNTKIVQHLKGDIVAASILEAIKAWVDFNSKNNTNFHEGYFWTYNTAEAWALQLGFCTVKQFYKKISKLRDRQLIYTKKFNCKKGDQTLWYRINQEKYQQIIDETYQDDDDSVPPPSKRKKPKQADNDSVVEEREMASDFPTAENSYITNISKKKKKKEIRRRGWYLPPDHEDYNSWSVSEHLRSKLKQEYRLTDAHIEDAYKEFVLYNNAMGIKIRSIVSMFTLWCKRYSAKLRRYVKRAKIAACKVNKVIVQPCKNKIISCIEFVKDSWVKGIHLALLEYYGPAKYKDLGLLELRANKLNQDNNSIEIDFASSCGLYLPDGIHKLRAEKGVVLDILRRAGYQVSKVKICGI